MSIKSKCILPIAGEANSNHHWNVILLVSFLLKDKKKHNYGEKKKWSLRFLNRFASNLIETSTRVRLASIISFIALFPTCLPIFLFLFFFLLLLLFPPSICIMISCSEMCFTLNLISCWSALTQSTFWNAENDQWRRRLMDEILGWELSLVVFLSVS